MRASILTVLVAAVLGDAIAALSANIERAVVPDKVTCNVPNFHNETNGDLLNSQISALRNSGKITLGSKDGGSWCIRLSCESGSDGDVGIYACNDASSSVTIDGSTVADFAEGIMNTTDCNVPSGQGQNAGNNVQGQAFNDTARWNVILGMADGDKC